MKFRDGFVWTRTDKRKELVSNVTNLWFPSKAGGFLILECFLDIQFYSVPYSIGDLALWCSHVQVFRIVGECECTS